MSQQSINIADIRMDYILAALDEETAGSDPFLFFNAWFREAEAAQITEINAMTLATAGADAAPHARIVLLKGLDDRGFVFFTNYDSAKGEQLAARPYAAMTFFWPSLERQVRIEGQVERVSLAESDAYFQVRPLGSRIGAWASPQSRVISDRQQLESLLAETERRFMETAPHCPEHWGGYRLLPERIEFWQGRASRLHDRLNYRLEQGDWQRERLAP